MKATTWCSAASRGHADGYRASLVVQRLGSVVVVDARLVVPHAESGERGDERDGPALALAEHADWSAGLLNSRSFIKSRALKRLDLRSRRMSRETAGRDRISPPNHPA